jgi:DNA-directed RNA polymerase subunit L
MDEQDSDPLPAVATIEVVSQSRTLSVLFPHLLLSSSTHTLTQTPPFTQLGNETETNATFCITHEDHTLGNALRWTLAKNPNTSFVGYSVPHPSNPVMHLRLQTHKQPATAVLEQGLTNLVKICDEISVVFDKAIQ